MGTLGDVFEADMPHFGLGRTFNRVACPINTVPLLTPSDLGRRLQGMARNLEPRSPIACLMV
jgi:hypothetical protein